MAYPLASIVYLSHGGGPLPLLDDPDHREMLAVLEELPRKLIQPDAIVVVSAHWEEAQATVASAAWPALIYDYYGFPESAYQIEYPAPGAPGLAQTLARRFTERNIPVHLDESRGFDHGLFVPLKIMYPEATIPCVQLSLLNNLDPARHIELGEALAGLNQENILIIGSGFSFHNMRAFFSGHAEDPGNIAFDEWLTQTCMDGKLDERERRNRFNQWSSAPFARYNHPREEHLLPLHVCYGAAQRPASQTTAFRVLGKQARVYLW